jgi:predicted ArsR family transcriptional regulator
MDRKAFLKNLTVAGTVWPCCSVAAEAPGGKCETAACGSDAKAVRNFLSDFLREHETTLDRNAMLALMKERGRACCRALEFRQKLIADSQGSLDRLVELMGKIVGPENCRREGDCVTLIYPSGHCGCGWSPKRAPTSDDPYCDCSKANNQLLFETVSGKPVRVEVAESPRRGGARCRFIIQLV